MIEVTNLDDILVHHGVQGMKWGVRNYQNKDGSLTQAGKEHYASIKSRKVSQSRDRYGRGNKNLSNKQKKDERRLLSAYSDKHNNTISMDRYKNKYYKSIDDHEKASDKWGKLDDKAERLADKAAYYEMDNRGKPSYSAKKAKELWAKSGAASKEADDLWEKVSALDDSIYRNFDNMVNAEQEYKKNKKEIDKLANKYIEKYGQIAYDDFTDFRRNL